MKKIIEGIAIVILAFGVLYLLASFVETEIDFRKWSKDVRAFIGIFGGVLSILSGIIIPNRKHLSP